MDAFLSNGVVYQAAIGSLLYWLIIIIIVIAVVGFLFGRR